MITAIIFTIWIFLILVPIIISSEYEKHYFWFIWAFLAIFWIIPIFTGIPVKNNEGQYKGYVTAVEQNGAIFKGWNVYLKTELESSDADVACIDRDNENLINKLKYAQENKESVSLKYEGVWQYPIGVCPNSYWMIKEIINK